jgi:hypothetical protein
MPGSYPPDWPEIAERIKRAARWRCENCDHKHDPHAGYTLTVHHLDGDKSNCHWRNLVALCQRCHLHIQGIWRPGQLWLIDPPYWAVWRGHVPGMVVPEMTPFDLALLAAIRSNTDLDGAAHSLFHVAVFESGLHYRWALHRLNVLEALGYVRVERPGAGLPLVMRVNA